MKPHLLATLLLFLGLTFACASESAEDPACGPGEQRCAGACVDPGSDAAHCGGCGIACDEDQRCSEGACVALCPEGMRLCDGACVDPAKDRAHCGGCGQACEEDLFCSRGECATSCEEDRLACEGSCVDPETDEGHCGGCGQACGEGEACAGGSCDCAPGFQRCGERCVDLKSDASHCGDCETACSEVQHCAEGACACPEGETACGASCVDTASDAANCGGCGEACGTEQHCAEGACACPEGLEVCGDACVDLASDEANCGGCGDACPEGDPTSAFACEERTCTLRCAAGWGDCEDTGLCVTALDFNASHCGQCGNTCEGGQICIGGECACPAGTEDCDGICVDTATDPLHCGGCGVACPQGQGCSNGVCCDAGETGCGLGCFDLETEAEHCGRCGDTCLGRPNSSGGSCSEGACALVCEGSYLDCNLDRTDGCEADSETDPDHCGGCDQPCALGRCAGGTCAKVLSVQGHTHTCAVVSDGSLYCWGSAFSNKLQTGGAPNTRPATVLDPAAGGLPMEDVVQVAGGFTHTCALFQDGSVRCWGASLQRGNPDVPGSDPVRVKDPADPSGFLSEVVQIDASDTHTCARKANGQVRCWGANGNGQLGGGNFSSPVHAVSVVAPEGETGLLSGAVDLATGYGHSCAILDDASVVCWGHGNVGQLGRTLPTGTRESTRPLPVLDASAPGGRFTGATRLALGESHSCALMGDGTVKCWGRNAQSELGNGDKGKNRSEPTLVPGLSGVTQISAYYTHVCARLSDGTAKCWGYAGSGAIGNGSNYATVDTPSFVLNPDDKTDPLEGIDGIHVTALNTCAIRGTALYCWGSNSEGSVGDGTTDQRTFPTLVQW